MDCLIFSCDSCGVFARTTIEVVKESSMILCYECCKNFERENYEDLCCNEEHFDCEQ